RPTARHYTESERPTARHYTESERPQPDIIQRVRDHSQTLYRE
ncbi:hypothetical protein T11_17494, partial [Trichinella zimbabwensis]